MLSSRHLLHDDSTHLTIYSVAHLVCLICTRIKMSNCTWRFYDKVLWGAFCVSFVIREQTTGWQRNRSNTLRFRDSLEVDLFIYFTFDKAELAVLLSVFMLSSAHHPIFTFHCQKAAFSQKPHAADVNTSTDKTMMKSFFILLYSLLRASALFLKGLCWTCVLCWKLVLYVRGLHL